MPELGDIREVRITSLAAGGRGVGRVDGRVWFVERAFPGDRVMARAERIRPSFVEGATLKVIERSPLRREPSCPVQPRCGGCPWMPLDETVQASHKRMLVIEALGRLGGLEGVEVEPVRQPGPTLGYRNRVELTYGHDSEGKPVLGLYGAPSELGRVDVPECLLQDDAANALLATIRHFLLDPARGLDPGTTNDYRVVVRRSTVGRSLLVLREGGHPFPAGRELAREVMSRHQEVTGVVGVRVRPGQRGGARRVWKVGEPWLEEKLGGRTLRLPPSTFVQAHAGGNEALVSSVAEEAGEVAGLRVVDLYGGVGGFSFDLVARGAARSVVCDADADAIACGRAAAERKDSIRFVHADARKFLHGFEGKVDLLVANPPRSGLGRGVAAEIARHRPRRVVMISCDPPTLARDLRALVDSSYAVSRVVPLDLFPQTAHVEAVAALERVDA